MSLVEGPTRVTPCGVFKKRYDSPYGRAASEHGHVPVFNQNAAFSAAILGSNLSSSDISSIYAGR
jgi:hypothetical protein